MSDFIENFQPGRILNDAIVAAFRANGTNLGEWCRENDVLQQHARMVLLGSWSGEKGKALLTRLIEAAGSDTVQYLYSERIHRESKDLKRVQA